MAIVIPIVSEWNSKGVDAANADMKSAQSGWGKAGSAIQSAVLPAGAALAGLGAIAMKGIGAAEEAAAANAKLSKVFDSMDLSQNTQAALDYADALSKTIGVDDEVIKGAQTKLATFSEVAKSTETMARATSLAADLSAAGFGSMDSAAVMLGKAIQDPIKGMSAMARVGVTFSEAQQEQIATMVKHGKAAEAQAIIMDSVAKQVGGVAEASATGSAKMGVAFGEVEEAIGAGLLPAFEKLQPLVMAFAQWAQDNAGPLVAVGVAIAGIAASIIALATAMKVISIIQAFVGLMREWEIATKLANVQQVIAAGLAKAWAAAQWLLNIAMEANPIGLIIIAIVALIALFVIVWKHSETFRKIVSQAFEAVWKVIKTVWEAIKRATAVVWDWLIDKIKWAWNLIKFVFIHTNPILIVITYWDKIKAASQAVWEWIVDKIKWAWDMVKTLFHVTPLGLLLDHLDDLKAGVESVFDWLVSKAQWLFDKLSAIFGQITSAFDKVGGIIDKINPFASGTASAGGASVVQVGRGLTLDGHGFRSLSSGLDVGPTFATQRKGSSGPTINIWGAIDPEGTARQVKRLLEGSDVRQGRAPGQARAVAW